MSLTRASVSALWRQSLPVGMSDGSWFRWLWVPACCAAFVMTLFLAAARAEDGDTRAVVRLLLVAIGSGLAGALLRSISLPYADRLGSDSPDSHPRVVGALRRLGAAVDQGVSGRKLLELTARSALEIVRGESCVLTLLDGSGLYLDRFEGKWLERDAEPPPLLHHHDRIEGESVLRTQLTALGETIGSLDVFAEAGKSFDYRDEARFLFYCAKAAVASRDGEAMEVLRDRADALQSRISDMELWKTQLDVYADDLARTYNELSETKSTLDETYMATLEALANAVDARDPYTYGHCRRVAELACLIARQMEIDADELRELQQAALLHDIGKIGVPDAVLRKTTPLTAEEWASIQTHPELGFKMLSGLRFLERPLQGIRHHHERFDGSGYPGALTGEHIPSIARILSVADAFDAITSDRPYRPGRPAEQGLQEIERSTGSYFDPTVVEALLAVMANRTSFVPEAA